MRINVTACPCPSPRSPSAPRLCVRPSPIHQAYGHMCMPCCYMLVCVSCSLTSIVSVKCLVFVVQSAHVSSLHVSSLHVARPVPVRERSRRQMRQPLHATPILMYPLGAERACSIYRSLVYAPGGTPSPLMALLGELQAITCRLG